MTATWDGMGCIVHVLHTYLLYEFLLRDRTEASKQAAMMHYDSFLTCVCYRLGELKSMVYYVSSFFFVFLEEIIFLSLRIPEQKYCTEDHHRASATTDRPPRLARLASRECAMVQAAQLLPTVIDR